MTTTLFNDDCLAVMKTMADNSVSTIITDPPYALTSGKSDTGGFMGKKWDTGIVAFSTEVWEETLRITRPGGFLLAFGGTRTHHRLMCAIEDAGWEIRDVIMYVYGSGFPKNKLVLKPAYEPIILSMAPVDGNFTNNLLTWGISGLNIDAGRIEDKETGRMRWPSNLIIDGSQEVLDLFPMQKSGAMKKAYEYTNSGVSLGAPSGKTRAIHDSNSGSAARFFYSAKAAPREKFFYCSICDQAFPLKQKKHHKHDQDDNFHIVMHPTQKPLALMEYLVKLTAPPANGLVLDMFAGTATTGVAATLHNVDCICIEKDYSSFKIGQARVAAAASKATGSPKKVDDSSVDSLPLFTS